MVLRILKWTGVVAVIAVAASLVGLAVRYEIWNRDWSTIDDGWASLIGSAMGSFFAVVGALYVTKATERRKKKEFEDFVRVAVQNIVVQASYLEAMAREPHKVAPTPEIQAGILSIQLRNLTDALAVFEREVAGSKDGAYKLRRGIISTDAGLREARPYLDIDAQPIQSIESWHIGAYQTRHHASRLLHAYGWIIPIPTSDLIGEAIQKVVTAWRSWNIPQANNLPTPVERHFPSQPLHHAHA